LKKRVNEALCLSQKSFAVRTDGANEFYWKINASCAASEMLNSQKKNYTNYLHQEFKVKKKIIKTIKKFHQTLRSLQTNFVASKSKS